MSRMFAGASIACLVVLACASPPAEPMAPGDVVYDSGGTDEAWLTIDDATPIVDDTMAPSLIMPTGTIARTGPPPTFAWNGGVVGGAMVQAPPARGLFDQIASELFPVAHAHEPPVTGPMYGLTFDLGAATPLRVLTGATTYTPDAPSWARVLAATNAVTLEITGTYLQTGRITQGPYVRAMPYAIVIH